MKRMILGILVILSLTGVATVAQADHCKKWSDCFFEDLQRKGGS